MKYVMVDVSSYGITQIDMTFWTGYFGGKKELHNNFPNNFLKLKLCLFHSVPLFLFQNE